MFDDDRAKQLQKQSHVRGALSKEFYSNEQSELQRKRREMKRILDEQVEQRKRAKQKQKQQQQKKHHREEQNIKRYYEGALERDRKLSDQSSNLNNLKNNQSNAYSNSYNDSLVKQHFQQGLKHRANSKTTLQQVDGGNIPLMPVMALSEGHTNTNKLGSETDFSQSDRSNQVYANFERENPGNIPLLDLSDETNFLKNKKKSKTQIKRQKTERQTQNNHVNLTIGNSNVKLQESRNPQNHQIHQNQGLINNNLLVLQNNGLTQSLKRKERRRTLSDDQNTSLVQQALMNSKVSKGSKFHESVAYKSPVQTKRNTEMGIPEEIQEMQNQNRILKSELKKSQQAISLLIGAVRSNPKLDKFRVRAEKILHNYENNQKGMPNQESKVGDKKEESPLLLPKLKIKHQSFMHDYLLEAARRAKSKSIKSQTSKH